VHQLDIDFQVLGGPYGSNGLFAACFRAD
jgi:hypothetical protein